MIVSLPPLEGGNLKVEKKKYKIKTVSKASRSLNPAAIRIICVLLEEY